MAGPTYLPLEQFLEAEFRRSLGVDLWAPTSRCVCVTLAPLLHRHQRLGSSPGRCIVGRDIAGEWRPLVGGDTFVSVCHSPQHRTIKPAGFGPCCVRCRDGEGIRIGLRENVLVEDETFICVRESWIKRYDAAGRDGIHMSCVGGIEDDAERLGFALGDQDNQCLRSFLAMDEASH